MTNYNDSLLAIEQAVRTSDRLSKARGILLGGLATLGVRTIWYRHPHVFMGMLFDTVYDLSNAQRLRATILAGESIREIERQQRRHRIADVPHSMRPLWGKLLRTTAYRELYDTVVDPNRPTETIAIPLVETEAGRVQLFLGGFADNPTYTALIADLDRLRETALVYHDHARNFLVPGAGKLTRHELLATSWAMQGKTNWEIAQIEGVSESAITKRISNAMSKIEVTSRSRLVTLASTLGLETPPVEQLEDQAA